MTGRIVKPARELPHPTPIGERMMFRVDGQATWQEPQLNTTCRECFYFDDYDCALTQIRKGVGRCRRAAELRGGNWAKQIDGRNRACSEFAIEIAGGDDG